MKYSGGQQAAAFDERDSEAQIVASSTDPDTVGREGIGAPGVEAEEAPPVARIAPFPTRDAAVPQADSVHTEARPVQSHSSRWPVKPWIVAALVIVAGVIAWVVLHNPSSAPPPADPKASTAPLELAGVDVAPVEARVLSRSLPLSGSMSPVVQATVKSKVSGEVEQVTVREGQDVRQGDVIARIDTRNLQAQYDREMAAVDKARADLDLATLNRDKNRSLLEQRYISQNTYEATESAYAGMVANLKLAEAQSRVAKISLDDAVIRAPFTGTIAKRLVQPGGKVSMDAEVVTLVDLRQMLLEAAVPAADIPSVQIGQKARFRVGGFGERDFEGEIQRINPVTSEGSRAITIYIAVDNPDRALKGGMFGQGDLTLESTQPVLSIPAPAVRDDAGMPFVYTLQDGKITQRTVSLGPLVKGNAYVEVRSGLKGGERVIVASIGEVKSGSSAFVRGEQAANR